MRQSVKSGERVAVGSTIEVVIAGAGSGNSSLEQKPEDTAPKTEQATVPKVEGQSEANAKNALEAAGLKTGSVTEANSDTVPAGSVISQAPAGNTSVEKGSKVNLVISKGPANVKVTDVIGHEESRATRELQEDGFKVSVKDAYSEDMSKGLVISMSPDRGTFVAPGSTVTITVSRGREQVKIPSVSVGMTYEHAADKLEDAGFEGTIQKGEETSESVVAGYVTRFSPDKTVDPDGTVTIYVSTGSAVNVQAPEEQQPSQSTEE